MASIGVDFPGKSDSRSPGTEECTRRQKTNRSRDIEELYGKQNKQGMCACIYLQSVSTQIKYMIQLYTHVLNVFLSYNVHLLQMCAKIYVCHVCRYICCFIYKYTKSLPLSTMKCYDDIPKLPLKTQWNNAINIRN